MNWKQQDTMTVKERKEMKEISNKTGVSKRVIRTIRCKNHGNIFQNTMIFNGLIQLPKLIIFQKSKLQRL